MRHAVRSEAFRNWNVGAVVGNRTPLNGHVFRMFTKTGLPPENVAEYDLALSTAGTLETPERFYVAPLEGEVWVVAGANVYFEDAGKFGAELYGAGAALTNGLTMGLARGVVEGQVTPLPITKTGMWGAFAGEHIAVSDFSSSLNNYAVVHWIFEHFFGAMVLDGDIGDSLWIDVRDNMNFLVSHFIICAGRRYLKS